MNHKQLRELIVKTLRAADMYSEEATDLLMLTAAQESHCGEYIQQICDGPALGIFQMEPATISDLFVNFLAYKRSLHDKVYLFQTGQSMLLDLEGNILFQIITARVQYLRKPEKIPKRGEYEDNYDYIYALATYWKKHWNTEKGNGSVTDAMNNYNRYVRAVHE